MKLTTRRVIHCHRSDLDLKKEKFETFFAVVFIVVQRETVVTGALVTAQCICANLLTVAVIHRALVFVCNKIRAKSTFDHSTARSFGKKFFENRVASVPLNLLGRIALYKLEA
jgi:hypothetical protein